jgi:hypothetical protein
LDGQVVILAEDEVTAKAGTRSWFLTARPWLAGKNDTRQMQRSDVAEPDELKAFYGFGIGTKAIVLGNAPRYPGPIRATRSTLRRKAYHRDSISVDLAAPGGFLRRTLLKRRKHLVTTLALCAVRILNFHPTMLRMAAGLPLARYSLKVSPVNFFGGPGSIPETRSEP